MSVTESKDIQKEESGFLADASDGLNIDLNVWIPDKFSDFRPLYVSESGSCELYTASRFGKRYVLKCLKEAYRQTPLFMMALAKEFEIGMEMDHQNIVKTIGFEGIDGHGNAIVMEYIDGESLDAILAGGVMSKKTARSIASQLADAIRYSHSKQIIHRDIKPKNIMVTHIGNVVKLIDFGLSDSNTFTMLKMPSGTRGYMAPEQMAQDAKADVRGDIYSYGAVVRQLAMLSDDAHLLSISKKCLSEDAGRRPQSFEDISIPGYSGTEDGKVRESFLDSKSLTLILLVMITVLAALLGYLVYTKFYM